MFGNYRFQLFVLLWMLVPASWGVPVLVNVDWLIEQRSSPEVVIVDMSKGQGGFKGLHIPGSVHLPYAALVARDKRGISLRISDERLYEVLGGLGIDSSKHVVIYDEVGGLHAGRLFWELERIGHPKVSVLNGGIAEWVRREQHVAPGTVQPKPGVYKPNGKGRDNEAGLNTVLEAMGDAQTVLLDVRTEGEYRGMALRARTGHIPGARWWPWEQALRRDKGLILKDKEVLGALLERVGVAKENLVIAYCGSGHRASQTYLTLRHLGLENVKLYDGSMSEWSREQSAPVRQGMQP